MSEGRARIVIVVAVSFLVVAGVSLAFGKFARGNDPAGLAQAGYLKYADYGGSASDPGGCPCCTKSGSGSAPSSAESARAAALRYYASKYGAGDVSCEVKDFGCHQEAEIIKDGAVVKRLSIRGGRVTEL